MLEVKCTGLRGSAGFSIIIRAANRVRLLAFSPTNETHAGYLSIRGFIVSYSQQIIDTVSAWEGISVNPHRFGGTEFNVGKVEIGHVHGSSLVDVPFTRKIREVLVSDGEAQPHHLLPESGWVSFYLRRDGDVDQGIKLLRLSYVQKQLRRAGREGRAVFESEIAALMGSAALKKALLNRYAGETEE